MEVNKQNTDFWGRAGIRCGVGLWKIPNSWKADKKVGRSWIRTRETEPAWDWSRPRTWWGTPASTRRHNCRQSDNRERWLWEGWATQRPRGEKESEYDHSANFNKVGFKACTVPRLKTTKWEPTSVLTWKHPDYCVARHWTDRPVWFLSPYPAFIFSHKLCEKNFKNYLLRDKMIKISSSNITRLP